MLVLSEASGPEVIDATGVSPVTISGADVVGNPVIQVDPGLTATLKALKIINGSGSGNGGGISNAGTLTLSAVKLVGDQASRGGAIDNAGDLVVTSGCSFVNNAASESGGAIYESGGAVTIADSALADNKAANGGAVYVVGGSLTIQGGTLTGNSALDHGGGIDDNAGTVKISDECSLSGNVARSKSSSSGSGGGIYEHGGTLTISGVRLAHNSAVCGGGLYVAGGALSIAGSMLQSNNAYEGGAIFQNGGAVKVSGSCGLFSNNAQYGGAIVENSGSLSISGSNLSHNTAVEFGGGLYVSFGSLTISGGTLIGNTATAGGGLFDYYGDIHLRDGCGLTSDSAHDGGGGIDQAGGTLSISDSTLSNDKAASGGGVLVGSGVLTISGSTLSGDTAGGQGGGVDLTNGTLMIDNSTLAGNTAATSGGGIFVNGGSLSAVNDTFAYNSVGTGGLGGGLDVEAGTATIENTIVALNFQGVASNASDVDGVVSGSFNLIGSGGSGVLVGGENGNMVGVTDPGLTAPGDFGGLTETIALLPGSPAIGMGNRTFAPATDQRGVSRTPGSTTDVGAFESRGFTITVSGGNGQGTPVNTALAEALQVRVASAYNEPVDGGVVTFSVLGTGAGATLSSSAASIGAGGVAWVTATANDNVGSYTITASASGVATPGSFTLSNDYQPAFSGVTSQTITYGTSLVTFTGSLGAGSQFPAGDDVRVTVGSIAQFALIADDGSFSVSIASASLNVVGSPYAVSFSFQAQGVFLGATATSELTVQPAALTITAETTSKTYGQTVTFSEIDFTEHGLVNGDAITGVTLVSAGAAATAAVAGSPYAIVASGAVGTGLGNYTISYASGELAVAPAALTITADSTSKTYGQAVTLTGTEFTETGLVNGDTITGVTVTCSGSAATAVVAGSPYVNSPSGAVGAGLGNYTISYVNGGLTVEPAALTITAESTSKTYGQAVTLTGTEFTASGLVNGDTITSVTLTSAGAAATAAVAGSPYAIVVSGAVGTGLGNYTISYMNGSLAVQTAPLTITADSTSKTYGQAVTFTGTDFTESGLVNGDTITGVTLVSAGAAATAVVAGSPYTIVPSGAVGAGLGNYTISDVNGSLAVQTAPLTITAESTSKTYGQVVTLTETDFTESGLVNGDTITGVTLVSAGAAATAAVAGSPYAIVASGAVGTGLGNYTISYVSGGLTVEPAALTITAESTSKTYGQAVTFTGTEFTESGLVNGDAITSLTLTSAGAAAAAAVAGSPYTIVPSGAVGTGLGNYTISYVNGGLTVEPAALTITAESTSKTYGQAVTLTGTEFTETGLVNGDTITSVTLTSAGAAATAVVAGSPYAIVASGAVGTGLGNYTISYVNGGLTVEAAALTITAESTSKTYGQAVTLTGTEFTASGLVNGDTITSVTLTSAGAAATAVVAGSPYAIVPSGAVGTGLGNYTISYVNGGLTVAPAALTITAETTSKTYGQTETFSEIDFTEQGLVNGDTITSVTLTKRRGRGDGCCCRVAVCHRGEWSGRNRTRELHD